MIKKKDLAYYIAITYYNTELNICKWVYMSYQNWPKCPSCHTNDHVILVSTNEKITTLVGAGAGAVVGYTGATSGAVAGAVVGSVVPILGTAVGAVAGGIIGAFTGGSAGAFVGKQVGKQLDESRKAFKCNVCNKSFSG